MPQDRNWSNLAITSCVQIYMLLLIQPGIKEFEYKRKQLGTKHDYSWRWNHKSSWEKNKRPLRSFKTSQVEYRVSCISDKTYAVKTVSVHMQEAVKLIKKKVLPSLIETQCKRVSKLWHRIQQQLEHESDFQARGIWAGAKEGGVHFNELS